MKYDDASWHYGGEFPSDLPDKAGATHIGMFVTWGLLAGHVGEFHNLNSSVELILLGERVITPGAWFISQCDGKFTSEDFNDSGNTFASAYYSFEENTGPTYFKDYATCFLDLPSIYHVEDSWENFSKIEAIISQRAEEFSSKQIG